MMWRKHSCLRAAEGGRFPAQPAQTLGGASHRAQTGVSAPHNLGSRDLMWRRHSCLRAAEGGRFQHNSRNPPAVLRTARRHECLRHTTSARAT
jgi:hypothetical protein